MQPMYPAPPRARRRGRGWRIAAIVVVVLAILLIAADRVGDYVAERVAGDTIQKSQQLSSRPDVDIAGFPFLNQLVSGDFGQIAVSARDVPIDKDRDLLNLSMVHVVLHHVTVPRDLSSIHTDEATAEASVTYAELSKRLGVDVRYTGSGRITASKTITIGGQTLHPSVSASPQIVGDTLSFGAAAVNGLGSIGNSVAPTLTKIFDLAIPLQGIPFQLRVRSIDVTEQGLELTLTGSDLTYRKGAG